MELRRGKQRWEWLPASGRPAAAVSPPESPGACSGTSPIGSALENILSNVALSDARDTRPFSCEIDMDMDTKGASTCMHKKLGYICLRDGSNTHKTLTKHGSK